MDGQGDESNFQAQKRTKKSAWYVMYGSRRISNTSRTIYDLWEDVFSLRDVTWRCQVWTWRLIRDRSDLLTFRWLLRRRLRSFCGVRTHTHTHTHICTKKNRMKDVAWQFIYGSRRMTVTSCMSSLFLWGPHTHTHTHAHTYVGVEVLMVYATYIWQIERLLSFCGIPTPDLY